MTKPKLELLRAERFAAAIQRDRPPSCVGCPLNPGHPEFDPLLSGGFVPPSGPLDAEVLAVGIAPAQEEEAKGEPLVGPSGRRLERGLRWASGGELVDGSSPEALSLRKFNLVQCRTTRLGARQQIVNRDPLIKEIKECYLRFLGPELLCTQAKVVVPLGTLAFNFLVKRHLKGLTFGKGMGHRIRIPRAAYTLPKPKRRNS